MISAKRAFSIVSEIDHDKRNELIDKLSEEDAKYILKQYLTVLRESAESDFEYDL